MFRTVRIRHYIQAMQARGFAAESVLSGTDLTLGRLKDPTTLVEFQHYKTIVSNMMSLTGNQGIAFEIGADAEFVDLGIVGHAILSCRNVRDSINLWTRYSNALVGLFVRVALEEKNAHDWVITITESAPMGFLYNFCTEEVLTIMCKLGGKLSDQGTVLEQLDLSYPAPSHQALYSKALQCEPNFNRASTRARFSAPGLDSPLRGSDEEFNRICLQHCTQIMRQIAGQSALVARLRNLLLAKPGVIPDLDSAAGALGMSSRTLRRRLSEEGYSYHQLIRQFRFDLAKEYLSSSDITAKEVSYLLGFSDVDAFRRAFKLWSGRTVNTYQLENFRPK